MNPFPVEKKENVQKSLPTPKTHALLSYFVSKLVKFVEIHDHSTQYRVPRVFLKEIAVSGHKEEDRMEKRWEQGNLQERDPHAQARCSSAVTLKGHVSGDRSAHDVQATKKSEHRYFLFLVLTILSKTISIKDCRVVFFKGEQKINRKEMLLSPNSSRQPVKWTRAGFRPPSDTELLVGATPTRFKT